MPINPRNRGPLRTLAVLFVLVVGLYGLLAAVSTWGTAQRTPKLGLDLEGGTQLILQPKLVGNQKISDAQVNQAVDIIRQRVDGSGIAEAEVTTQGAGNIVVSLPGTPSKQTVDALSKASQLSFRAVLVQGPNTPAPTPSATPSAKPTATPSSPAKPSATSPAKPSASPSATTSGAKSGFPPALQKAPKATPTATASPAATATPAPSATTPAPAPSSTAGSTPATKPQNGSDLAWVTPDVEKAYTALNCQAPNAVDTIVDDPAKPMVTCSADHQTKYILGPTEVFGRDVKDASSGLETSQNGAPTGRYEIQLSFNSTGAKAFGDVTSRLYTLQPPRNEFGIVLDNVVISAPAAQGALTTGSASITGDFTAASAKTLADQLKFGALPMSFNVPTTESISPQLGSDQLTKGLIAGAIGLALVVLYSLFQYRALGFVTIASLAIATLITYAAVTLLGWSNGFRLTMAGVTGLIVSIGITADSFIIYFERVRDEVREGRPLRGAVETGWKRARRTVLISDGVNFLAAVVLYILAASNVRGFAFTLMLTTIIDVVIVFLFTHPLLSILSHTEFFGNGHKWSGLDPERLGAKTVRYAGRGRVTIADRRAAAEGGHR